MLLRLCVYVFFATMVTSGKSHAQIAERLTAAASESSIDRAAFSADGTLLAITGYQAKIEIWDVRLRKRICALGEADQHFDFIAFLPDGKTVAAHDFNNGGADAVGHQDGHGKVEIQNSIYYRRLRYFS